MNRIFVNVDTKRLMERAREMPVKAEQWGQLYDAPDLSRTELIQIAVLLQENSQAQTADSALKYENEIAELKAELTNVKRQLNVAKARAAKKEKADAQQE